MISVTDGDTVDTALADGSTEGVRLIGVDTPEVYGQGRPVPQSRRARALRVKGCPIPTERTQRLAKPNQGAELMQQSFEVSQIDSYSEFTYNIGTVNFRDLAKMRHRSHPAPLPMDAAARRSNCPTYDGISGSACPTMFHHAGDNGLLVHSILPMLYAVLRLVPAVLHLVGGKWAKC